MAAPPEALKNAWGTSLEVGAELGLSDNDLVFVIAAAASLAIVANWMDLRAAVNLAAVRVPSFNVNFVDGSGCLSITASLMLIMTMNCLLLPDDTLSRPLLLHLLYEISGLYEESSRNDDVRPRLFIYGYLFVSLASLRVATHASWWRFAAKSLSYMVFLLAAIFGVDFAFFGGLRRQLKLCIRLMKHEITQFDFDMQVHILWINVRQRQQLRPRLLSQQLLALYRAIAMLLVLPGSMGFGVFQSIVFLNDFNKLSSLVVDGAFKIFQLGAWILFPGQTDFFRLVLWTCQVLGILLAKALRRRPREEQRAPLTRQIAIALPRKQTGCGDLDCAVCWSPIPPNSVVLALQCDHAFHIDCLVEWLIIDGSCPICRTHVLPTRRFLRDATGLFFLSGLGPIIYFLVCCSMVINAGTAVAHLGKDLGIGAWKRVRKTLFPQSNRRAEARSRAAKRLTVSAKRRRSRSKSR